MSTPHPRIYFGIGTVFEFTTPLTLPAELYQSPKATEVTLSNFQGSVKNSLNTLKMLAGNMSIDLTKHVNAINGLIDAQLVIDKEFVAAFKTNITVEYSLNIADNTGSVALSVVVQAGAVTRQFFHSTVNANTGILPGARKYGNASDAAA